MQWQITEQQKLDSLERVKEQHEQLFQQMRDPYEKDIYQSKEKCNETQKELNEKHEFIHMPRVQLETVNKNVEMASVERADTITRLTKSLNDLQTKYDQDWNQERNLLISKKDEELQKVFIFSMGVKSILIHFFTKNTIEPSIP